MGEIYQSKSFDKPYRQFDEENLSRTGVSSSSYEGRSKLRPPDIAWFAATRWALEEGTRKSGRVFGTEGYTCN